MKKGTVKLLRGCWHPTHEPVSRLQECCKCFQSADDFVARPARVGGRPGAFYVPYCKDCLPDVTGAGWVKRRHRNGMVVWLQGVGAGPEMSVDGLGHPLMGMLWSPFKVSAVPKTVEELLGLTTLGVVNLRTGGWGLYLYVSPSDYRKLDGLTGLARFRHPKLLHRWRALCAELHQSRELGPSLY